MEGHGCRLGLTRLLKHTQVGIPGAAGRDFKRCWIHHISDKEIVRQCVHSFVSILVCFNLEERETGHPAQGPTSLTPT